MSIVDGLLLFYEQKQEYQSQKSSILSRSLPKIMRLLSTLELACIFLSPKGESHSNTLLLLVA